MKRDWVSHISSLFWCNWISFSSGVLCWEPAWAFYHILMNFLVVVTLCICSASRDPNNDVSCGNMTDTKDNRRSLTARGNHVTSASCQKKESQRFDRSFSLFFPLQSFDIKKWHKSTFPTWRRWWIAWGRLVFSICARWSMLLSARH